MKIVTSRASMALVFGMLYAFGLELGIRALTTMFALSKMQSFMTIITISTIGMVFALMVVDKKRQRDIDASNNECRQQ